VTLPEEPDGLTRTGGRKVSGEAEPSQCGFKPSKAALASSPLKTELAIKPQGKTGISPMTANGLHSPPEMSDADLAAPLS